MRIMLALAAPLVLMIDPTETQKFENGCFADKIAEVEYDLRRSQNIIDPDISKFA